jgi:predicted O-methyltransferase YrrM
LAVRDYSIEAARRAAKSVKGYLFDKEGQLLYDLARQSQGPIVEIGSYHGKSTVWLAYGARAGSGAHIHAIDPHLRQSEAPLRANLERLGLADQVTIVTNTSADAVKDWNQGEIGMLWIDGSHRYDDVAVDVAEWGRFLRPGGFIALHDTVAWDGPRRVVDEIVRASKGYSEIGLCRSITYATRKPDSRAANMLRDRSVLATRRLRAVIWRIAYVIVGTVHGPTRDRRLRMADKQQLHATS